MTLYRRYITLTNQLGAATDDMPEAEVVALADLARTVMADAMSLLMTIPEIFDDNLNDSDSWDESDVCVQVSHLLQLAGFFLDCPSHGVYARTKPECPTCEGEQ